MLTTSMGQMTFAAELLADATTTLDDAWLTPAEFEVYVGVSGLPHRVTFTPSPFGNGECMPHQFEYRGPAIGGMSDTGYRCYFVPIVVAEGWDSPYACALALAEKILLEIAAAKKSKRGKAK